MSSGLNLAQHEAVNHLHGPCLVLAGAGSGKTRVITHKIGRLIQCGLEPERIAAIIFTNKAAAEMRERVKSLVGRDAQKVLVCTFHALGVRMLRQDGTALGLKPQFSILDSDDVTSLLKDAGGTTDAATARQWQWTISKWKNMGLDSSAAAAQAQNDEEGLLSRIMARYEERLTAYQSVDFDDLIGLPLKLLRDHPEVRERWQQQMGHVLVDEYQDTNATQYEVLKHLVGERAHFTAVGDDDQSIYGWRGAEVDNILRFDKDFPGATVIRLERNYRSTGHILAAAAHIIAHNEGRLGKTLHTEDVLGEKVTVTGSWDSEEEARSIGDEIENLQRKDLTAFEEAEALHQLALKCDYTHEEMARKLGKSRTSVTEILALNAMPEEIRNLCRLADIHSKSTLLHIVAGEALPGQASIRRHAPPRTNALCDLSESSPSFLRWSVAGPRII